MRDPPAATAPLTYSPVGASAPGEHRQMGRRLPTVLKVLGVLACLYLFFISIQLRGDSF